MSDYKQISIKEVPSYYWTPDKTIKIETGEVLPWYEAAQKYPNLGVWVDEEGRPASKKQLIEYGKSFYSLDLLDKADQEEVKLKLADEYANTVSPNVIDILNIGSMGFLNRLSPTLNIGLIIDTFQGDNFIHSWLGNSGIVSDNFAQTHPYWSLAINGGVDMVTLPFITSPKTTINLTYDLYHSIGKNPVTRYKMMKFGRELLNNNLISKQLFKNIHKLKIRNSENFDYNDRVINIPKWYKTKMDKGFSLGHELGHGIATEQAIDDFYKNPIFNGNYSYHPDVDFIKEYKIGNKYYPTLVVELYADYVGNLGGKTSAETVLQIPTSYSFANRVISNPQLFPQPIQQYGKLNLFRGNASPDFRLFGEELGSGSESIVYNHPINKNIVYKVNTDYTGDINKFIENYVIPRNETPIQLPLRVVGKTAEGYPISILPKVSRILELSEFESLIPEINKALNNLGFHGDIKGSYLSNGKFKIGDFNAGNIGFDVDGNLRFIDIDAYWK